MILRKVTWETRQNTFRSETAAPLPYLLIPVKAIQVEKVSLRDMQNLSTVFCSTDCRELVFSS